ncbi:hypothetical protein B0T24DRAFT_56068 [Lasiosphaeria ovina]|uniref:Uncharacterized protein n=1 Tax=Lasiosphaeria ovina TaxID=92902 RepID=A0AAE0NLC4_9PEZI|nr:hypothetical protein B0T24DRAFT_56068 [Lasiosphaeria ovina]
METFGFGKPLRYVPFAHTPLSASPRPPEALRTPNRFVSGKTPERVARVAQLCVNWVQLGSRRRRDSARVNFLFEHGTRLARQLPYLISRAKGKQTYLFPKIKAACQNNKVRWCMSTRSFEGQMGVAPGKSQIQNEGQGAANSSHCGQTGIQATGEWSHALSIQYPTGISSTCMALHADPHSKRTTVEAIEIHSFHRGLLAGANPASLLVAHPEPPSEVHISECQVPNPRIAAFTVTERSLPHEPGSNTLHFFVFSSVCHPAACLSFQVT